MTYKHAKFEDSPVMRSLERVAREKGLVKPEPLTKHAALAKKADLTPTASLLENIFKLCAGLRERGFDKHADELEVSILNYKKAQTLYETSPEKGEDLVHAAHPQGSHKLEGVEAENDGAVFEDILDQYAKSLQVVEKKPTGKLATRKAIQSIKVVFAEESLQATVDDNMSKAKDLWHQIDQVIREKGGLSYVPGLGRGLEYRAAAAALSSLFNQEANMHNIQGIASRINNIFNSIAPGATGGGVDEDAWDLVNGLKKDFSKYLSAANVAIREMHAQQQAQMRGETPDQPVAGPAREPTEVETISPQAKQIIAGFNKAIQDIDLYKSRVSARGLSNATALNGWLEQASAVASKARDTLSNSKYSADVDIVNSYNGKLAALNTKLTAFQQKWLP